MPVVADQLVAVEGQPLERWSPPKGFDQLTAQFPNERIILESAAYNTPTVRAIDLISTLGRDPFRVPPAEVVDIPVRSTWVGGRMVHAAG